MSELSREQLLMAVVAGKGPAYLRGVDLTMLDLSNAGWLIEADLRQSNLSYAILSRSNLKNAKLEGANLQEAKLAGANLEGADLSKAKLITANLRYANLRGAKLCGANLVGANLFSSCPRRRKSRRCGSGGGESRRGRPHEGQTQQRKSKDGQPAWSESQICQPDGDAYAPTQGRSQRIRTRGWIRGLHKLHSTVRSLLQLACLSRSNMMIKVNSDGKQGIIEVQSGRVCHAQSEDSSGEAALLEILDWGKGSFETEPLRDEASCTIDKPLEHLILESVRQRDERYQSGDHLNSDLLINELRTHTPIRAFPTKGLLHFLAEKEESINPGREILVNDVFDSGESAGLMCAITADDNEFIAPLKYIKLRRDHPLFRRVFEYIRHNAGASHDNGSGGVARFHG